MSVRQMTLVWEHSQAKGSGLLILLAIADIANDDGTGCYAGIEKLAKKVRLSERSVRYIIKKLEEMGELEIERRASRYGTNVYRVTVQRGNPLPEAKIAYRKPIASEERQPIASLERQPIAPNTLVKPSVNPSVKTQDDDEPLFYAVGRLLFKLERNEITKQIRYRVGKATRAIAEIDPDATAKSIERFVAWWKDKNKDAHLPWDAGKLQMHYLAFAKDKTKKRYDGQIPPLGGVEQ